ncbi:MAG: hypothetical protein HW394_1977, partial [Acidobacteria bacterium]|nr:hypothetical protein [Acidobacteriota bacterium]
MLTEPDAERPAVAVRHSEPPSQYCLVGSRCDPTVGKGGKCVRDLLLRRKRARLPWVYLVYHRHAP